MLESMLRVASLAPAHDVRAWRAGLPSSRPLSVRFVRTHLLSLDLSADLDARAAPLQEKGVGILCQDVPAIPAT